MTRARDIANLVDANGDIVAGALDNVPAADLVNDTTPQLGGNLDAQTNDITNAGKVYLNRTTQTKNTDALVVSAPSGGVGGGNSRVDLTVTAEDLTGDGGANANAFVTTKAKGNYYTGLEVASTSGHIGGWIGHWNGGSTSRNLQARVGGTGLNASDTLAIKIDEDGYVTMPKVPAFNCASTGSNTSTGAFILGSSDKGQSISHNLDQNGLHNTSNGRFTAPVSGHYFFSAMASPSQGANSGIRIERNGSQVSADAYIYGQSYNGSSVSAVVYMSANDYANALHVPFNGTTEGQYSGQFSGFLIG